jgi:hypothetical protein
VRAHDVEVKRAEGSNARHERALEVRPALVSAGAWLAEAYL